MGVHSCRFADFKTQVRSPERTGPFGLHRLAGAPKLRGVKRPWLLLGMVLGLAMPAWADEVLDLIRDKRKLETEVVQVFARSGLGEDPAYKKASEAALQASRDFTALRKKHPALKSHYEASTAAQKKMADAQRAGDVEARKAATAELARVWVELEKASAAIPELEEARRKAQEANAASEALRRELLAGTEEGKALLERLNQLDARIAALREEKKP